MDSGETTKGKEEVKRLRTLPLNIACTICKTQGRQREILVEGSEKRKFLSRECPRVEGQTRWANPQRAQGTIKNPRKPGEGTGGAILHVHKNFV